MWEYRVIDLGSIPAKVRAVDVLNSVGQDGWELVAITFNCQASFKRHVAPPKASRK